MLPICGVITCGFVICGFWIRGGIPRHLSICWNLCPTRRQLSDHCCRFMPVPVETGIENGEYVEIVDGLAEGAEVAMSGQFLLDASASLNEAAQRMQGHD